MATQKPEAVPPGPKDESSREEVRRALQTVLSKGHGRAASIGDINEVSEYSHQTVHDRLKDLRDDPDSGVKHGEIGGTAVYWIEDRELATGGGFDYHMIDGFFRHISGGWQGFRDSDNLGLAAFFLFWGSLLGVILAPIFLPPTYAVLVSLVAWFFALTTGAFAVYLSAADELEGQGGR